MTTPIEQFIEQMGLMAQAEGAPRIAGQILGYLIVEGAPRTLTQMTEALKISKASASTNARLLEFKGSIRRVSKVGMRQDAYEAVEDPGCQMLQTLAQRFRGNARTIEAIGSDIPDARADARARVMSMADFYRRSADFLDDWKHTMAKAPDAPADTPEE